MSVASIPELFHFDLLWNIFFQFFPVADDSHQLIGSGQIDQCIHGIFHGLSIQCSESFIHKQSIHLNTAQIRRDRI